MKPSGPGKSKTFVMSKLMAKFRMAGAKPSKRKRKRRYAPKPNFKPKLKPKTSRRRRPRYPRFKR